MASQQTWPVWNVIAPTSFAAVSCDVDVFEDDGGALAAELQLHGREILAARFGDQAADFGRAGEAHALAGRGGRRARRRWFRRGR